MEKVFELQGEERKIGAHLFNENQYDKVLIHSVLDGHTGRMLVDSKTDPSVARLDTGAFTLFGGDPEAEQLKDLIEYAPVYIVTPENETWANVFVKMFGDRITRLPFTEYYADTLDAEKLTEIIQRLPSGYKIKRLDKALCEQLPKDIANEYFYENFVSIDDFLDRGVGFCIMSGDEIVSAATSMASARNEIDIEIETKESFQKKGLGTIVGAQLVLHCVQNKINPKWLAANDDSEKLAERLGYSKGDAYETFEIEE